MRKGDMTAFVLAESAEHSGQPCRVHAVAFDDANGALDAAKRLREEGFTILDVHSPFPIHGIEKALGWRETRLGYATLVGGLVGFTGGLALQMYTHGFDWPLNIGGKTSFAWPAMLPVVFEMTVLFAAFATVLGLVFSRRLRPRWNPAAFIGQPGSKVNDDRFVLLVLEQDASFSLERMRWVCEELCPVEIIEGWKVFS